MGHPNQNAKAVRWGWSNYPAVQVEEVVNTAGEFVCPYCKKTDEYHVVVYMEQDLKTHVQITECIRTTCCHQKIAVLSKN